MLFVPLIELLETEGITQRKLAKKIGVTENTVGLWAREEGKLPKWASVMFTLLLKEKELEELKSKLASL
ncbi:transcriptional regulator [Helicobacter sp. 11S02629-2]|uniref:transcriptional regulator n=1 Tax=Helicobacter sp. 11S02629-2 TaxID=1476195 RepID=UPI000BA6E41D|nr:transcriptional regulator [Helicobacter sp. 11S02629-2]PAF45374.1 hypothetical protein BKH40_04080 [Helicobacter sp. 11S02629-2]